MITQQIHRSCEVIELSGKLDHGPMPHTVQWNKFEHYRLSVAYGTSLVKISSDVK